MITQQTTLAAVLTNQAANDSGAMLKACSDTGELFVEHGISHNMQLICMKCGRGVEKRGDGDSVAGWRGWLRFIRLGFQVM